MTPPEAVSSSGSSPPPCAASVDGGFWEAECAAVQGAHALVCAKASGQIQESAARRRAVWGSIHRRGITLRAIAQAAGVDYSLVWQVIHRGGLAGTEGAESSGQTS